MKRNHRRTRKNHEPAIGATSTMMGRSTTIADERNATKSKEQMKRDWGSKRATMNNKLNK